MVTHNRDFRAQMLARTKSFALAGIRVSEGIPKSAVGQHISRQLVRSATSVGANYRAACRARSAAEFIAKLGIVEEEADECMFWIEMLNESGIDRRSELDSLRGEANELLSLVISSIKSMRAARTVREETTSYATDPFFEQDDHLSHTPPSDSRTPL